MADSPSKSGMAVPKEVLELHELLDKMNADAASGASQVCDAAAETLRKTQRVVRRISEPPPPALDTPVPAAVTGGYRPVR